MKRNPHQSLGGDEAGEQLIGTRCPVNSRTCRTRASGSPSRGAGGKHRRRELKRQPADDPDGAAEAAEDFGKFSSGGLNGRDQDATRKRAAGE
jgi:hypothetical protein